LKLAERRLIYKYMERLNAALEAEKEDKAPISAPDWCNKRLKTCTEIISRDDKIRVACGLPLYTHDELRQLKGVKVLTGDARKELLVRLGVMPSRCRPAISRLEDWKRSKRERSSSPPRSSDTSSDKKRRYDSSSSNKGKGRGLLSSPPSLLSINTSAVQSSLYQMQQQQQLRNLMALNAASMGASSSGFGAFPSASRGSLLGNAFESDFPPQGKILRLDEYGSYSVKEDQPYRIKDGRDMKTVLSGSSGRPKNKPVSLLDL